MAKNMLSTQGGTPPLKKHVDAKMLFRAFRAKKNLKMLMEIFQFPMETFP